MSALFENETGNGNESPNRLSHAQFYEICEALKTRREEIEGKGKTLPELAAIATGAVGFDVSRWSVKSALEAVGIEREASPELSNGILLSTFRDLIARVEQLETRVAELESNGN